MSPTGSMACVRMQLVCVEGDRWSVYSARDKGACILSKGHFHSWTSCKKTYTLTRPAVQSKSGPQPGHFHDAASRGLSLSVLLAKAPPEVWIRVNWQYATQLAVAPPSETSPKDFHFLGLLLGFSRVSTFRADCFHENNPPELPTADFLLRGCNTGCYCVEISPWSYDNKLLFAQNKHSGCIPAFLSACQ